MYYSSEVRAADEFRTDTSQISAQEVELAILLVQALAGPFAPTKYKDHYQENLRAMIDAKVRGQEMEERAVKPALAPVVDILEALKASLARKKEPQRAEPQDRPTDLSRKRKSRVARQA